MYNVDYADKLFIKQFAWLARDLAYDPENIPTEERVDNWRMTVMNICHEHKSAHKEIKHLQTQEEELLKIAIRYHRLASMMTKAEYAQWDEDAVTLGIDGE